jgi:hypothetical protein
MNILSEDFETGTLDAFASTTVPAGPPGWSAVNTAAHNGSFSAFVPDINSTSDQRLTLNDPIQIPASSASATLTFWHRFAFEGTGTGDYDGGVLETSTDGGGSWQDAGPNITTGGYNGTISSDFGNPLAGRMAWAQNPNGSDFVQVIVNLLPYAGQNLLFRFREGTDSSISGTGWWVDDIQVSVVSLCPTPTPTPTPTASCAISVTGSITASDSPQTGRLNRLGTASGCGSPNGCSVIDGSYHYHTHSFVNRSNAAACVTATLTPQCGGPLIFAGAYLDSFDPVNICTNNIGDPGMSPMDGSSVSFGYTVPAGATFLVVLSEVASDSGCSSYTLDVAGLPCPTPTPSGQALNISTRLQVQTGDNVLIGGFIVTGSVPKNVALRGIGPSLTAFGVSGVLADPTLELRASNGSLIMQNDNWNDDPGQGAQLTSLGLAPQDPHESAMVVTLPANSSYTAVLAGKDGGTGVGLVEVYDVNRTTASELSNISTRGFVLTENNVMIGGFILGDPANAQIAVRGLGPSLAAFGLSPVLANPTLELHDSNGATLAVNDNWQDDPAQAALLTDHGLALPDVHESGIFQSLPPGAFTVILAGDNGGTGIGLVEIYNVH